MGEKSKKIGEIGENIVGNFFKLIGWTNSLQDQELACLKAQKHASPTSKTGKKQTHGIDYLLSYKSPLEDYSIESILVSVKHSADSYTNSPINTFKKHLADLAYTLECYNKSGLKRNQAKAYSGFKRHKDTGVLFWLSSSDDTYHNVISKLDAIRLDDNLNFDSIHVVDNQQIEFIFDFITFLRRSEYTTNREILFYYPGTSLNLEDQTIPRYGVSLPVEFISSPIIPLLLRCKSNDIPDIFCIAAFDSFDEESLIMLIQAAKEYTKEMKCQYLFLFPNYVPSKHNDNVTNAKQYFDGNLFNQILVANYNPDYRSLNNVGK